MVWELVHWVKAKAPSDEPTVQFLVAPDELQRKSSEHSSTKWSNGQSEDTVGLSNAQFESRQRRDKTTSSALDEPTPWVGDSVGLSNGHEAAYRDVLSVGSSAAHEPTHRRCHVSEQLCQRIFNGNVTWRAPDEPTPRKSIGSVHLTLTFSVAVSQRLFRCLGLFIPPPLTDLRELDCVEVQRSSGHLEDHIQSIQVLNCSSLDLHMISVCL
jgi:hypothetical protein